MFVDNTKYNQAKQKLITEKRRQATINQHKRSGKAVEYKGKPTHYWAEKLNSTEQQIRWHLKKYGNLEKVGYHGVKYKGKLISYWANHYNVHVETISKHLKKYGNLEKVGKKRVAIIPENTTRLYGKTVTEWSRELNRSQSNIYGHFRKYGHIDHLIAKGPLS